MSVPCSRIDPAVGVIMPRMACAVVDFPQPDSPTNASISPWPRLMLIPSTAWTQRRRWPVTA